MNRKSWSKFETEADFRAAFARHYVIDPETGCWNWIGARMGAGYGTFRYRGRQLPAHRVMYEWTYGGVLEGMYIRHKCNNKACVNPAHLISGSPSENVKDAWVERHKKAKPREVTPKLDRLERRRLYGDVRCKLTEEQVLEAMRLRSEERLTYQKIADRCGVTEGAIRQALQGKRWGYLGGLGEMKRWPKLGAETIREIRLHRQHGGLTYRELAPLFGVSEGAVGMALKDR